MVQDSMVLIILNDLAEIQFQETTNAIHTMLHLILGHLRDHNAKYMTKQDILPSTVGIGMTKLIIHIFKLMFRNFLPQKMIKVTHSSMEFHQLWMTHYGIQIVV